MCFFQTERKKKINNIIKIQDNKSSSKKKNNNNSKNNNKKLDNIQKNKLKNTNNKLFDKNKYNNTKKNYYQIDMNNYQNKEYYVSSNDLNYILEINNYFFEDKDNNYLEENRKNELIEEYKKITGENKKNINNLNSILSNVTEKIEDNFGFIKEIKNDFEQTKDMMITCGLNLEDKQIINNLSIYEFMNDQEEYKKYFNEIISKNREEIEKLI